MKYTPKRFLDGLVFSTFISTYQEWHAFINGFCEVLCPWPPRVRIPSPSMRSPSPGGRKLEGGGKSKGKAEEKLASEIFAEYHYYMFGRALGVIAWLIIAKIIKEVFW